MKILLNVLFWIGCMSGIAVIVVLSAGEILNSLPAFEVTAKVLIAISAILVVGSISAGSLIEKKEKKKGKSIEIIN